MTIRQTRDEAIRDQRRTAAARAGKPGRWPIPTDTSTDRARTLANALYAALVAADPEAAAEIKDRAHGFGETWLGPQGTAAEGPWLTREEVARLAKVSPDTVSQWTSRRKLTRHPGGYAEREVLDFLAARRTRTPSGAPQEDQRDSA